MYSTSLAAAQLQVGGRGLKHQDSETRERYAAEIVRRGLNKEGWKLVITGTHTRIRQFLLLLCDVFSEKSKAASPKA